MRLKFQAVLLVFFLLLLSSVNKLHADDLWKALQASFKLKDYSRLPQVKAQILWLKAHPDYIENFANQSKPYIFYILEQIKKQGLPGELALLPLIESDYNPFAYSHAGAAGLWQLMPGTGSGLGIKQDWWYDGRRDILPSTQAALTYLTYLAKFFNGDWLLAIAAYDSGEGTVQKAVRYNQLRHKHTDFWSLSLPRETQAYLPRLLALASIIHYPHYHRYKLPAAVYKPYFKEVDIGGQIELQTAAKIAEIDYSELLKLNPGHNRWTTSPNIKPILLIPLQKAMNFINKLKTLSKAERLNWKRHVVQNGDTLGNIALKNKSSIQLIKRVNNLSSHVIHQGQTLLVPQSQRLASTALTKISSKLNQVQLPDKIFGPQKVIHIVQKNENFSDLEKKYHVKAAAIRFWNQLQDLKKLPQGKKLILWLSVKKPKHTIYLVKAGDSLSKISSKYHISMSSLKRWNPRLKGKAYIYPKQRLKLYL